MLKLEEIKKNAAITGIELGHVVRIVTTEPEGTDALSVYNKTSDGRLLERMLFRSNEHELILAEAGRPWAFDASGEEMGHFLFGSTVVVLWPEKTVVLNSNWLAGLAVQEGKKMGNEK